ncbi:hypothetical protein [Clostridium rectalis]|uniref:hypothetical protein n=1 Tax=Clostridium rectalis TaxID=2040295 RepID=UPI000F642CBD|nr:hypothetical protein [Clostridium rectalis]
MDKIIKIINIEVEGDLGCNHKWCCNPVNKMMVKKDKMIFVYDRVCEFCLRKEIVKSNRKGENFKRYKKLL